MVAENKERTVCRSDDVGGTPTGQEVHGSCGKRELSGRVDTLANITQFWSLIYGDGEGYLALFSGRREGHRLVETRSAYYRWPAHGPQAAAGILGETARDRELYQCGHLVTRPRRRKEDAAPLSSLWVDLDHDELNRDVPPPSVVVQSSPGRLQAYWRLSAPVSPTVGEVVNRRLAHALSADMTGWSRHEVAFVAVRR
jgi:hypothetical protein